MKTKHLLLSLLALLGSTTLSAYDDVVIDGIRYYLYDYSGTTASVVKLKSGYYSGSVVIPASVTYNSTTYSVTSIISDAFRNCSGLTSVTIPNSVSTINSNAFEGCTNLTSIDIPNSVTTMGESVFYGCTRLASATIGSGLTSISTNTFRGCTSLNSVTIPNNVTRIGSQAFSSCSALTSITIPSSVTTIDNSAFYGSGLTTISIPASVTSFGSSVFMNCSSLNSVTINSSTIGEMAFKNCTGLTSVNMGNSVSTIGSQAFYGCSNITSLTIGNNVTSISSQAFYGCSSLTSVTIPNSVTSIWATAFQNCSGLTSISVGGENTQYDSRNDCNAIIETSSNTLILGCKNTTIPNSVISIGSSAFYQCSGLTSIIIPNSVTSIGSSAFFFCSSLTSVTCLNETPPSISSDIFSNMATITLYVPAGSKSAYEAADYWKNINTIVELADDVTIGSTGYATYCSNNDLDFSGVSGLKAYIASGFSPSTGKLVLTRVDEVPAGEGLYLVGEEGTYTVPFTTTDMLYSNFLKGVTTATTISPTEGSYTNFILSNGSYGVGFYTLSSSGELAAGKAYLQLPTASVSNVKAISLAFEDDVTAIQDIEHEAKAEKIYNLQGQQVNAPRKGMYIINGKKVILK